MSNRFFILVMFTMLCSYCYSMSIDDFIKHNSVKDNKPSLFVGEEFIVTADDGTKFVIQNVDSVYRRAKPIYSTNLRVNSTPIDMNDRVKEVFQRNMVPFVLMPENREQILFLFVYHKDFWKTHPDDYTFIISKLKDFENVTTYDFVFDYKYTGELEMTDGYGNPKTSLQEEKLFWIDTKENKYSGSDLYPPVIYKYEITDEYLMPISIEQYSKNLELKTYYLYAKDMWVDYVENELEKIRTSLNEGAFNYVNDRGVEILDFISIFDKELADKFSEERTILEQKSNIALNRYVTDRRFEHYTRPVSEIVESRQGYPLFAEAIENRPKFELPRTQDELEEYVDWITEIFERFGNVMLDAYGMRFFFGITPEGLLIKSAGPDKMFGTEDDFWYIREYPKEEKAID